MFNPLAYKYKQTKDNMTLGESFAKWREKKKDEKEEFKAMEREERFKKKLEEKHKTPAQKELEFYHREKAREELKRTLEVERKERAEKMKELSNPYKHDNSMMIKNDVVTRRDIKWV